MEFDMEIFESPAFWLLSIGSMIAIILSFSLTASQGLTEFPLWEKIVILFLMPVISYIIVGIMSK